MDWGICPALGTSGVLLPEVHLWLRIRPMRRYRSGHGGTIALAGITTILVTGACATEQRIAGIVPIDWPSEVGLMPVEVPLPRMPTAAAPDSRSLNRILVRMRVGSGPATTQVADIGRASLLCGGRGAVLRTQVNLADSDRGKPVEFFVPDRPGNKAAVTYTSSYREPFLEIRPAEGPPVLRYWHGAADSKNARKYPLNGFIHPLAGLDGETLTAASPGDHVHHRGVFWAWVRTERQGRWQNEWWIPREFVAEPGILAHDPEGTDSCGFTAEHFWTYRPADPTKSERFVRESVDCRVYDNSLYGRAVDVDLTLTALEDGIRIGGQTDLDKGYGGMTCRFGAAVNVLMENDQGVIRSSSLNHVVAKWVDWTGEFLGPDGNRLPHRSGAALMVHPSHPAYPPEWIVRAYGPIGLAYPGLQMIELPKGAPLHLRYRFWVHRGDATSGKVPEAYRAYVADWNWRAG